MTIENADLGNQQSDQNAAQAGAGGTSGAGDQTGKSSQGTDQSPSVEELKAQLEEAKTAREQAEKQFKEYQSGLTPKLQRLAEIEKAEQAKAQVPDEVQEFDKDIADVDQLIIAYKNNKDELGNPAPVNTKHLELQKRDLERNKARVLREQKDRQFQGKYAQILEADPKFQDFAGVNAIILEYQRKGEEISPLIAYDRYKDRQELAAAKSSSKITAENKQLGDKAQGADGKPAPKAGEPTHGQKERARLFGI